ncbi:hypothetical protein C8J57DRAFT_1216821 [Mycena rebaudengoi]|nr:hypothetical protein C8J57DRAFT_1216821 [Mycena rebaudengoi]
MPRHSHSSSSSSSSSVQTPPTGSESDGDEQKDQWTADSPFLRASIAALPPAQLHSVMARLASSNPTFHRALESRATTTAPPKARHRRRRQDTPLPDTACTNCHLRFADYAAAHGFRADEAPADDECAFHPGQLEEEVFEFLSRTPEGRPLTSRRKIAMWTCCKEEPRALGCRATPAHLWEEE